MKHAFLFALLLGAVALRAQSDFPILKDLEGTWYQEGRQSATYSEWRFTDHQTFINQVFSIRCGDTTVLSRAVLRLENATVSLLLWTAGGENTRQREASPRDEHQVFQLVRSSADEIVFQNENPGSQPRQLTWRFFSNTHLTLLVDAAEFNFYRRPKPEIKTSWVLQLGANSSRLANQVALLDGRYFQRRPGADLSLSFGLRANAPLGLNFEIGLHQRQIGVSATWTKENVRYARHGTYQYLDFYAACLPELRLGKERHFAVSVGVGSTIARRSRFKGSSTASETDYRNPRNMNPRFDVGREASLLAGFSWQLPKKIFPACPPSLYCRGTWGLGYVQVRSVSVGMGLQLKPH